MIVDFRNPSMPSPNFFFLQRFQFFLDRVRVESLGFFLPHYHRFLLSAYGCCHCSHLFTYNCCHHGVVAFLHCHHHAFVFPLRIGVFSVLGPFTGHRVFIVFDVFNLCHSREVFANYSLSLATS